MKDIKIPDEMAPLVMNAIAGLAKRFEKYIETEVSTDPIVVAQWQKAADGLWAVVRQF